MDVSTIIPIYNTAEYLNNCVDSILNSEKEFLKNEIILVNDGSSDNSLSICHEYASKWSHITVISQDNKGPASARLAGLSVAKGKYISFIDSDDYVEDNYYTSLFYGIKNYPEADIVVYNHNRIEGGIRTERKSEKEFGKLYQQKDILKFLKNNENEFLFYNPTKLYRKSIINSNFLDPKISLGEDTIFNLHAFYDAEIVVFLNFTFYNYCYNPNSLTMQKYRIHLIEDMEKQFAKKLEFYKSKSELNKEIYFRNLAEINMDRTFYGLLGNALAGNKAEFITELKKIRKTNLINFGFEYYNFREIKNIKKLVIFLLFKYKQYRLIKLLYHKTF